MKSLLVATMISLCSTYTPSQVNNGCYEVSDFMVNCAIVSEKEPEPKKIEECKNEFAKGKRYEEKKK
jgi:hypothetical protein